MVIVHDGKTMHSEKYIGHFLKHAILLEDEMGTGIKCFIITSLSPMSPLLLLVLSWVQGSDNVVIRTRAYYSTL